MKSPEIRKRFLNFFEEQGHAILPSASLVPENDPTVLFTTAGMHPLVPYLLGEPHPQGSRLANVQKCVRTQDIEDVGDNRHDTFFEMLGNWSLGDYFKKEAITWSWGFLTDADKGLGLDPSRLYVTVFAGDQDAPQDDESIAIWKERFAERGITAEVDKPIAEGGRIFTMSKESNWWPPVQLNPGPCGPDTEIFYDMGEGHGAQTLASGLPDFDSGRLVEIWNNVFMQFQKTANGTYEPLKNNNVDTGMGLERIAMITQQVPTIFETDLLQPIVQCVRAMRPEETEEDTRAIRIVSDHVRTAVMMIADGVRPSNKDRGYVLRRLIRRAVLHIQAQNDSTNWIVESVKATVEIYKSQYSNVEALSEEIIRVMEEEARKFQKTVEQGRKEIAKREHLTGKDAFDLYQTFGFPLELTKEYAQSRNVTIDEDEFESEFKKHQDLSRTASAGQFASGLADHSEVTVRYHTATHLLHQALRTILGEHVQQRGSNITPERLRFDFSHPEKMTPEQIEAVENLVNEQIAAGLEVTSETMSPDEAKNSGALGFFAHKYGDSVSVYSIGGFSKEICTGPHVKNTKELGKFRIAKEEAVSAGVRRIKGMLE